ncbi:MAG: Endonuclease/exonuclease/phosphatase [Monoraphidium minutum]|nr:MAG: Endonuclease/exonuclease/phosphatase [Monoraphidium minutum]
MGQLLWSSSAFAPGVASLAAVGGAVWIGGLDGRAWALDAASCEPLRPPWRAHSFPVLSIAGGAGPAAATLARDGSLRLWPSTAPAPAAAAAWRAESAGPGCLEARPLRVLAGTWNVNERRPGRAALVEWLGARSEVAQLVVVGLQEVEMGTGSVAMDRIYEQLARSRLEAGNEKAQTWAAEVGEALAGGPDAWVRVGLRQMSGIIVVTYVRSELRRHVGEVAAAAVACGVMGVGGNKGAAALSFSLMRRRVVVVASHFAAHQDKVQSRNADYAKIAKSLRFHNTPISAHAGGSDDGGGGGGGDDGGGGESWGSGMRDADLLIWLGDFNYRVDGGPGFAPEPEMPELSHNDQLYAFVHDRISRRRHLELLEGDQLLRQAAAGAVFVGLAEGPVTFMPTYKFEKGRESSERQPFYDQGEKKRVPAWTDRVLFRGGGPQASPLLMPPATTPEEVRVALAGGAAASYGSCLTVNDSDHKPVYCELDVALPAFEQEAARRAGLRAIAAAAAAATAREEAAALIAEPHAVRLTAGNGHAAAVRLLNPGAAAAAFVVAGPGPTPAGALPAWLEVSPASGVVPAGGAVELALRGSPAPPQWGGGSPQAAALAVYAVPQGSGAGAAWPVGGALAGYGAAQLAHFGGRSPQLHYLPSTFVYVSYQPTLCTEIILTYTRVKPDLDAPTSPSMSGLAPRRSQRLQLAAFHQLAELLDDPQSGVPPAPAAGAEAHAAPAAQLCGVYAPGGAILNLPLRDMMAHLACAGATPAPAPQPQPQQPGAAPRARRERKRIAARPSAARADQAAGRYIYLGSFVDEDEAGAAFDKASIKLRGDKGRLNFAYADYVDANGQLLQDVQLGDGSKHGRRRARGAAAAGAAPAPNASLGGAPPVTTAAGGAAGPGALPAAGLAGLTAAEIMEALHPRHAAGAGAGAGAGAPPLCCAAGGRGVVTGYEMFDTAGRSFTGAPAPAAAAPPALPPLTGAAAAPAAPLELLEATDSHQSSGGGGGGGRRRRRRRRQPQARLCGCVRRPREARVPRRRGAVGR